MSADISFAMKGLFLNRIYTLYEKIKAILCKYVFLNHMQGVPKRVPCINGNNSRDTYSTENTNMQLYVKKAHAYSNLFKLL